MPRNFLITNEDHLFLLSYEIIQTIFEKINGVQ